MIPARKYQSFVDRNKGFERNELSFIETRSSIQHGHWKKERERERERESEWEEQLLVGWSVRWVSLACVNQVINNDAICSEANVNKF